ncbi:MAG: hypothetical protein WCS73_03840 [Lentisphaeria bacterium]
MSKHWKQWPRCHRHLFIFSILGILFLMLICFVTLRPQWKELQQIRQEKQKAETKVRESSWPGDPERLNALLQDLKNKVENPKNKLGVKATAEKILKEATSVFAERIVEEYGGMNNFINQASQIEYRDQYDRLTSRFEGQGIYLSKTLFGMDETSAEEYKYSMLLKLWTVEKIYEILAKNNLRIVQDPQVQTDANKRHDAAKITVLPMKAYSMDKDSEVPYLQEYQVQFTVGGLLPDLIQAFHDLQSGNDFLPVVRMECTHETLGRKRNRPNAKGELIIRRIQAVIVCSTFFCPDESGKGVPVMSNKKAIVIPSGI